MKNLLEFLLLHLVDNPDEISIEEIKAERAIEYKITVHPEDVSKIIGKKGRIIKAIRKLAQVRAVKDQVKVLVTVVE
jgi:uncharacterized protein